MVVLEDSAYLVVHQVLSHHVHRGFHVDRSVLLVPAILVHLMVLVGQLVLGVLVDQVDHCCHLDQVVQKVLIHHVVLKDRRVQLGLKRYETKDMYVYIPVYRRIMKEIQYISLCKI